MKKLGLVLSFAMLLFSMSFANPAQARVTDRGLAVTGVVLGGTALGLAGYNYYQNRRFRNHPAYGYGYRRPVRYVQPVGYYQPVRNCPPQGYGYGFAPGHYY